MKTVVKEENKELAVAPGNGTSLAIVNLDHGNIPDMESAEPLPFDLMSDYWTPTVMNESKRLVFDSIKIRRVKDQQSDAIIELPCAFFYEKIEGVIKTVANGSKRLVGVIENYEIERGTPLLVTYLGKKKNATNSYQSDSWSVKPLMIKVK